MPLDDLDLVLQQRRLNNSSQFDQTRVLRNEPNQLVITSFNGGNSQTYFFLTDCYERQDGYCKIWIIMQKSFSQHLSLISMWIISLMLVKLIFYWKNHIVIKSLHIDNVINDELTGETRFEILKTIRLITINKLDSMVLTTANDRYAIETIYRILNLNDY